uniref:Quercetin 2,3-dioxygenase n=1 Tax=Panagrolaimus sp. PS1159 TaxID=55785 RepID=A0AC35EZH4_9BILA
MIYLRKANDRGHANRDWLDSWHTFSFASYQDLNFMGFSTLRVINEDIIKPGTGFGQHPHEDMEILTYVLQGTVEHKDSMGNIEKIPAGEFQIMSAGSGVTHSEYNASNEIPLHLYQIWIEPNVLGIKPRYEQKKFDDIQGQQFILTPDGRDGSLKVFQDTVLSRWVLSKDEKPEITLDKERRYWIQVVKGTIEVNGKKATTSDAFAIHGEEKLNIVSQEDSEILFFDLPPSKQGKGPMWSK